MLRADVPRRLGRGRRHLRLGSLYADASVGIDHFGASAPGGGADGEVRHHPGQRRRARPRAARRTLSHPSRHRPTTVPERPMSRLTDLYDQQGQSPWLDNLRRDWIHGRRPAGAGSTAASAASPPTPPSSRRRSRGGDAYDEQFAALLRQGAIGARQLLGARGRTTSATPSTCCARSTTPATASTATCRSRSSPAARPRHRRHRRGGPRTCTTLIDRAQPLREDPRHRRGPARHPGR